MDFGWFRFHSPLLWVHCQCPRDAHPVPSRQQHLAVPAVPRGHIDGALTAVCPVQVAVDSVKRQAKDGARPRGNQRGVALLAIGVANSGNQNAKGEIDSPLCSLVFKSISNILLITLLYQNKFSSGPCIQYE